MSLHSTYVHLRNTGMETMRNFDFMGWCVDTVGGMVAGFGLAIMCVQQHWITIPGH